MGYMAISRSDGIYNCHLLPLSTEMRRHRVRDPPRLLVVWKADQDTSHGQLVRLCLPLLPEGEQGRRDEGHVVELHRASTQRSRRGSKAVRSHRLVASMA